LAFREVEEGGVGDARMNFWEVVGVPNCIPGLFHFFWAPDTMPKRAGNAHLLGVFGV
jgi:hypothetical protein